MGTRIALASAVALHDSNRRPVPLEFSMAAIFPSRPRNLCGGGPAFKAGVTDPGYSGACARRLGKRRRVDLPYNRFGRFSAHLDFYWIGCDLGLFGIFPTQFRFSIVDARRDHVLRLPHHISLRSDETVECRATIFLKNCLNLRRSIPSGFISVCIHGRSLPIVRQTNPNRLAKR